MSLLQFFTRARQQFVEQRRSKRHRVQCPAWIELGPDLEDGPGDDLRHELSHGTQQRNCTVCDVSEDGARLAIESPESLPLEFWLVISHDGAVRRRCRVVWRSADQVGVCYLGPSVENLID